jgi:hypothetical protein
VIVAGAASFVRTTPPRRALAALALLFATAAGALDNRPDGFDGVTWGSSVATATAALPGLKPLVPATPAGATSSPMAFYQVGDRSFAGLKPCTATLGFIADRFYEVRLDCGRDGRVKEALGKRFGPPDEETDGFAVWRNPKVTVSLNLKALTFAFSDRALSDAAHQLILQKALSGQP